VTAADRPSVAIPGEALPRPAGVATDGLLELQGVSVHFALHQGFATTLRGAPPRFVRAVDGVDLRIRSGEVVSLVGESGCGKTTTGRALVRLAPISGGRVLLDGKDVTGIGGRELRDYRRRVQIIFQDPYESLNPKQMIGDIIAEPLDIHGVPSGAERAERVTRALESAGLRPARAYLRRFPHELSGGQRQRVAIAAAMVLDPEFVVADEPVSMLDVSVRTGILRIMMELRQSRGVGYLFITHDLSLAWLIADRIAVMYLGRVVETGPAERLVSQPRHPYTQALLSVMPSPDPKRRRRRLILSGETPDASRIPSGCRFHPRCPLAAPYGIEERCRTEDPPAFDVGAGVTSACWLAEPGGPLAGDTPWRGIPVVGDDGTITHGLERGPAPAAPVRAPEPPAVTPPDAANAPAAPAQGPGTPAQETGTPASGPGDPATGAG
jgi:oligopeptide/dipeptide ABC transporter ATP-binding protein